MRGLPAGIWLGLLLGGVGCSSPVPPSDPHSELVADEIAKLHETKDLLKGVTDGPSAAGARQRSAELRQELSALLDRDRDLGPWPVPNMKAISRRTAAAADVFSEWTRLLRLRNTNDDIRAIIDEWEGLLAEVRASLSIETRSL